MLSILIKISIVIAFYILSAYATTDITRLLKGSTTSVYAANCYCPQCNNKLKLSDQIPIFSYFINKGKCHYCKNPIPKVDFLLETILFSIFTLINLIFNFNIWGFICVVITFELTKVLLILIKGHRTSEFIKNIIVSIITNILIFGIIFLMYSFNIIIKIYG